MEVKHTNDWVTAAKSMGNQNFGFEKKNRNVQEDLAGEMNENRAFPTNERLLTAPKAANRRAAITDHSTPKSREESIMELTERGSYFVPHLRSLCEAGVGTEIDLPLSFPHRVLTLSLVGGLACSLVVRMSSLDVVLGLDLFRSFLLLCSLFLSPSLYHCVSVKLLLVYVSRGSVPSSQGSWVRVHTPKNVVQLGRNLFPRFSVSRSGMSACALWHKTLST